MRVLGIESSCDETAAAIVDGDKRILSNIVSSQIRDHERFGGVVPEIAARAHMTQIEYIVDRALKDANLTLQDIDGVAATCGPGLIGGVIVGMMAGKTIACMLDKPFIGINHLEGHALSPRLVEDITFPYLVLLVSGAHTQVLIAHDVGHYEMIGTTLDDAVGECFDKVGRMLGLPFPGGKYVAQLAAQCEDRKAATEKYPLPRPLKGREGCDFSFSGLKTAVLKYVSDDMTDTDKIMLATAMEDAVADIMEDRIKNAITIFHNRYGKFGDKTYHLVSGGGVAANETIKQRLITLTEGHNMIFTSPPAHLCTDNGAMIAWAGIERLNRGWVNALNVKARPRWPLEDLKREKI
jgi:N6-L-threonylcarbamoyladenine synthase